jgi:hypothetical protein
MRHRIGDRGLLQAMTTSAVWRSTVAIGISSTRSRLMTPRPVGPGQVDLESATASSETYVEVWLRTPPQDGVVTDLFHRGRYVDQWVAS